MQRCRLLTMALCAAWALALSLPAQAKPVPPKPTVAVLDFDGTSPAVSKQAALAPDKLSAALARGGKVNRVVDRSQVKKALEQAKEGPANTLAERVGAAVGADVVVEGQVARLDKKLLVTCKLTDLRTKSVSAQVAKGGEDHVGEIAQELADKIGRSLTQPSDDSAPPQAPAAPAQPSQPAPSAPAAPAAPPAHSPK